MSDFQTSSFVKRVLEGDTISQNLHVKWFQDEFKIVRINQSKEL